jgi:hypothetical protein
MYHKIYAKTILLIHLLKSLSLAFIVFDLDYDKMNGAGKLWRVALD